MGMGTNEQLLHELMLRMIEFDSDDAIPGWSEARVSPAPWTCRSCNRAKKYQRASSLSPMR